MDRRVVVTSLALAGLLPGSARAEILKVVPFPMADQDHWTERSQRADDLTPSFAFQLKPTVYVGGRDSSGSVKDPNQYRPLSMPHFARRDSNLPTAREALGHEGELADYYRQVMTATAPDPLAREENYWLRMTFRSDRSGKEIGFPYWDGLSDMSPFFDWLQSAADGRDFFDADQGWELRAVRRGERLHFWHGDLDTQAEFANLSVARQPFLDRLDHARSEVVAVIARLKQDLGVDPWS